ncbi:ribonuclease H-like domain-containing protein, partial [Ganoderma leucocontextum]
NRELRVPEGPQTNQRAELLAFVAAINAAKKNNVLIMTDSLTGAEGITKHLTEWEDKDYVGIKNEKEWRLIAYLLRKRPAKTELQWVQGHAGIAGNEMADILAEQGRETDTPWDINYNVPNEWSVNGARLSTLTQKQAYQLILRSRNRKPGQCSDTTHINISDAQDELERISTIRPTEEQIWKGLHKNPIKRNKTDFIWKLIHGRLRCGKYFSTIPSLRERQYCRCGEIESYDHMLVRCQAADQLYKAIESIWTKASNIPWNKPTIGIIRGLGAV